SAVKVNGKLSTFNGSDSHKVAPKLATSNRSHSYKVASKLSSDVKSSTLDPKAASYQNTKYTCYVGTIMCHKVAPKLATSNGSDSHMIAPKLATSNGSDSHKVAPKLATSNGSDSHMIAPKLATSNGSDSHKVAPKLATSNESHSHKVAPKLSSGHSTPPNYSSGPSTPPNYSSRSSKNAECSNCKHLRGKISVLKATMNMHMHPEQHTVSSATLLHEVLNEMEKLDLEYFVICNVQYVQRMSRYAIVAHQMSNGRVDMLSLDIRCPTDESICYRYTSDVQRMSRYAIVGHQMSNE
nr:hypothetical protein [Tanacetum cinerariifolium]